MRIKIDDGDNENWLNWGQLVLAWIGGSQKRPELVKDLKDQMAQYHVSGHVDGEDGRQVLVQDYLDRPTDPLVIMIPTTAMLDEKLKTVKDGCPYPLPSFYDALYGGAKRVSLSGPLPQEFAAMRVGEYTVNECC